MIEWCQESSGYVFALRKMKKSADMQANERKRQADEVEQNRQQKKKRRISPGYVLFMSRDYAAHPRNSQHQSSVSQPEQTPHIVRQSDQQRKRNNHFRISKTPCVFVVAIRANYLKVLTLPTSDPLYFLRHSPNSPIEEFVRTIFPNLTSNDQRGAKVSRFADQ